jgi:hypothetical protein
MKITISFIQVFISQAKILRIIILKVLNLSFFMIHLFNDYNIYDYI